VSTVARDDLGHRWSVVLVAWEWNTPFHRVLTGLGLAYAVDSATRHDSLPPEGIVSAMDSFSSTAAGRST
jgi:hypothetical protein